MKCDQEVETLKKAAALKGSLQQVAVPQTRNGLEVEDGADDCASKEAKH